MAATLPPEVRQELETRRLAGLALRQLRHGLDAGENTTGLPAEQVAALLDHIHLLEQQVADAWRAAADKLAATPHQPTALTGPYWYGQGWDDAVHHLRDLADWVEPAPRPGKD